VVEIVGDLERMIENERASVSESEMERAVESAEVAETFTAPRHFSAKARKAPSFDIDNFYFNLNRSNMEMEPLFLASTLTPTITTTPTTKKKKKKKKRQTRTSTGRGKSRTGKRCRKKGE
jgi:hypothetical protein